MIRRVTLMVTGKVQGVFFRVYTRDEGSRLGLTGTVRNLDDGRVEIIAEGEDDRLRGLIEWTKKGVPPGSKVEDVSVNFGDATKEWESFGITY